MVRTGCRAFLQSFISAFPPERPQDGRSPERPYLDTPCFSENRGVVVSGSTGLFQDRVEEPDDKLLLFTGELADLLQAQGQLRCGTRPAASCF